MPHSNIVYSGRASSKMVNPVREELHESSPIHLDLLDLSQRVNLEKTLKDDQPVSW